MKRIIGTYAFCHFAVDFCCVATMLCAVSPALRVAGPLSGAAAVVAYDMFAFMLQLPIGAALDGYEGGGRAAMLSYALVAAGGIAAFLPGTIFTIAAVALVSLGNALFHCAGGVDVLARSEGRAAPSGLFICTGAFGVFLGTRASDVFGTLLLGAIIALMLASALGTFLLVPGSRGRGARHEIELPRLSPAARTAIVLLVITVALRSYAGMVMAFPWKGELPLAIIAVCAVVAGKAAGGLVADRIGLVRTSALSLGLAALLFPIGWSVPAAGVAATFLFNFTMPITLIALAELMPENRGLAFGAASFALAVGAAPALMGLSAASGPALCILSLVSLAALLAGLAAARRSADG